MIINYIKRYLIVSLLTITGVVSAMACGPWMRPHYNVFSAFQRNQLGHTFTERIEKFWLDYAPELEKQRWELSGLSDVDLGDFDNASNVIVKTARDKNDREMLDYLRLLVKYLQISNDMRGDSWDYPSKEDLAQRKSDLEYIGKCARNYKGKRLSGQYCLLVMRYQMLLGDHASNLAYWNKKKDKLRPSIYKDMMQDIYAGALLNTGRVDEAADIYYQLGDMASLMWIMRDRRNLEGIKAEYKRNPNSPSLIFLVQDFVNNFCYSPYGYNFREDYLEGLDKNTTNKVLSDFASFAQVVINEKKTQVPALWQSAMGWVHHSLGFGEKAIAELELAMKMKGTERMIDNARVCRLVAIATTHQPNAKLFSFLLHEFKWMEDRANAEPADAGCIYCDAVSNHYTEVMQNLIYDSMAPRFKELGRVSMATALVGWQSRRDAVVNAIINDEVGDLGLLVADEYKTALDSLSAQELIDYYKYLNSTPTSSFEAMLIGGSKFDDNLYNDMVGTKMIREGRFAQAIPFLEKVSIEFLNSQAIAPYAAVRDYRVEQCFNRQTDYSEDAKITRNQKLDFCKEMVMLQKALNTAANPISKAETAYTMANYYFQASYCGNCWYLSRYGNSVMDTVCYKNEKDFLAEAASLYQVALAQPGITPAMKQCYLYASAFLPFGAPYREYVYDEDYNGSWIYNKQSPQYKALVALKQFTQRNPDNLAPYITKCDVLKHFLM